MPVVASSGELVRTVVDSYERRLRRAHGVRRYSKPGGEGWAPAVALVVDLAREFGVSAAAAADAVWRAWFADDAARVVAAQHPPGWLRHSLGPVEARARAYLRRRDSHPDRVAAAAGAPSAGLTPAAGLVATLLSGSAAA